MEERLRSRLNWGMVADIHPTTFELRLGIIEQKAEQDNIHLSPAVMEFLAHKITSNVRELEGALNRIAAYSTLIDQPVTIETVREVLADVLRASNRRSQSVRLSARLPVITISALMRCIRGGGPAILSGRGRWRCIFQRR